MKSKQGYYWIKVVESSNWDILEKIGIKFYRINSLINYSKEEIHQIGNYIPFPDE